MPVTSPNLTWSPDSLDFEALLADPDGFQIELCPFGKNIDTAVRLRTGDGRKGIREMSPLELTRFMQRFLTAIGGGMLTVADFDPAALLKARRQAVAAIDTEVGESRRKRYQLQRELYVLCRAMRSLAAIRGEARAIGTVAALGGSRLKQRKAIVAWIDARRRELSVKEIAAGTQMDRQQCASSLSHYAREGYIAHTGFGRYASNKWAKANLPEEPKRMAASWKGKAA